MAKSHKLADTLEQLKSIRNEPTSAIALETLRQVLKSKYSIAVAQAARIVGEAEIYQLIPDLVTAFERFMVNPIEIDAGCTAKQRIAEALYKLDYSEETLFLRGIRYVQEEAVWGGKEDKAVSLRGVCALGLVRMNYPQVLVELADLLADPESPARSAAAQAIAYTADKQGIPLLRLKARVGDKEPQVVLDCLVGLIKLDADSSLPFVTHFLQDDSAEICEAAALALGESRLEAAFPILKKWWEKMPSPDLRRAGLLAIAMLRQDQALDFLFSLIAKGRKMDARDAIAALRMYNQDESFCERVEQAIVQRNESENELRQLWQKD
jgi:HEAT repeat protein